MSKFWDSFEKVFKGMDEMFIHLPEEVANQSHTITQNGNTIKIITTRGKTKVTVNGKEYLPKDQPNEL